MPVSGSPGCNQVLTSSEGSWFCNWHMLHKGEVFHIAANADWPHDVTSWFAAWLTEDKYVVDAWGIEDTETMFALWSEKFRIITDEEIEEAREQARTLLDGI